MYIFEALMLICFGLAWPVSIYKSYISRNNAGKSVFFLYIILLGYIFGIIYQLFGTDKSGHWVAYIFALNMLMVMIDIGLYYRNRKTMIATIRTARQKEVKTN